MFNHTVSFFFHSQKAATRQWKCKLMIHRNNGAFTQEQRGGKMIETNSFTLLFLFSCCVSQSYYWVIGHEEIADKTCPCTTDINAFFFFLRSFALNLPARQGLTRSAGCAFWSAEKRFALVRFHSSSLGIIPADMQNINNKRRSYGVN